MTRDPNNNNYASSEEEIPTPSCEDITQEELQTSRQRPLNYTVASGSDVSSRELVTLTSLMRPQHDEREGLEVVENIQEVGIEMHDNASPASRETYLSNNSVSRSLRSLGRFVRSLTPYERILLIPMVIAPVGILLMMIGKAFGPSETKLLHSANTENENHTLVNTGAFMAIGGTFIALLYQVATFCRIAYAVWCENEDTPSVASNAQPAPQPSTALQAIVQAPTATQTAIAPSNFPQMGGNYVQMAAQGTGTAQGRGAP